MQNFARLRTDAAPETTAAQQLAHSTDHSLCRALNALSEVLPPLGIAMKGLVHYVTRIDYDAALETTLELYYGDIIYNAARACEITPFTLSYCSARNSQASRWF